MEEGLTLETLEKTVKELTHNATAIDLALPPSPAAGIDGFLTTPDLVQELQQLQLPHTVEPTADAVWQELFVHRTPISEPCRRVLTLFNKLGFRSEVAGRNLPEIRRQVAEISPEEWESRVYGLAKLKGAVRAFPVTAETTPPAQQPYALHWDLGPSMKTDVTAVISRTGQAPHHFRVHLPKQQQSDTADALTEAIELCQSYSCPLWVVVVPGGVVPEFQPTSVRIWLTGIAQPGLTVVGRALPPSSAYDWTRSMLELRGANFVAHASMGLHTPEQVASAWYHVRGVIARTLTEKYRCLLYAGWNLAPSDVQHDLHQLLGHLLG